MKPGMPLVAILFAGITVALFSGINSPAHVVKYQIGATDTLNARPLRFLMVGLGQDMSRISDGIWQEDYAMIRQGAEGIANHAKVTQEEMTAIRTALGDRFETFVSLDQLVHGFAVEMTDVETHRNIGRVLEGFAKMQEGCVSCHAAFRAEVRNALY